MHRNLEADCVVELFKPFYEEYSYRRCLQLINNFEVLIRLGLACLLGGLIGMERERNKHPAGLRTHILVCVGSTLVMLCNLFIFEQYRGLANIDPARFGAQVISGIGFLGAGTIIKEGLSIRGLTTAASLWAVACLGIAVGTGFYAGAILTTSLVLIILIIFSRFEYLFYGASGRSMILLKAVNNDGQAVLILNKLQEFEVYSSNISVEAAEDNLIQIRIKTSSSKNISPVKLLEELYKVPGIKFVQISD
jgi:putative Mg2+ transporter-C (MgtC) family protein